MKIIKAREIAAPYLSVLIYGTPGMGKTTLLGMLPGPTLIIDIDRGTNVLNGNERVDVVRLSEDLHEMPELLKELQLKCEYKNVCIDSLSELERAMLAYLGRLGKNNGIPTLQDYQRVDFKIIDYCRQFRSLPCNVIFTAWEKYEGIESPTGETYTQIRPMLRGKNTDNLCGLCDIVGRLVTNPDSSERFVRLEGSTGVLAKDRIHKRKYCKFEEVLNDKYTSDMRAE